MKGNTVNEYNSNIIHSSIHSTFSNNWKLFIYKMLNLPGKLLGIPHGPGVRELSKKSKSYFLAGGYVRATCPHVKFIKTLETTSTT